MQKLISCKLYCVGRKDTWNSKLNSDAVNRLSDRN